MNEACVGDPGSDSTRCRRRYYRARADQSQDRPPPRRSPEPLAKCRSLSSCGQALPNRLPFRSGWRMGWAKPVSAIRAATRTRCRHRYYRARADPSQDRPLSRRSPEPLAKCRSLSSCGQALPNRLPFRSGWRMVWTKPVSAIRAATRTRCRHRYYRARADQSQDRLQPCRKPEHPTRYRSRSSFYQVLPFHLKSDAV